MRTFTTIYIIQCSIKDNSSKKNLKLFASYNSISASLPDFYKCFIRALELFSSALPDQLIDTNSNS